MSCCPKCALTRELARVARSPLLANGGVGIYRGLIDDRWRARLLAEATGGPRRLDEVPVDLDTERVRGGVPGRRLIGVDGGRVQDMLFLSAELRDFIAAEVKATVAPCGERASYTIYPGAGSFLGIHRDVPGCDLALITCLQDSNASSADGALDFWPDDMTTPLDEIRTRPEAGCARLALAPGDSLLIHGGVVPHRIPPLLGQRVRVVSLMCFAIL